MSMTVQEAIARVASGGNLDEAEAEATMSLVMDGEASEAQLGGLLVGMRVRGETEAELTGFVRAMRARALRVDAGDGLVDTCGTGGDGAGTVNISTLAALVAAGAGARVAKHGNRAASSACGSADLLEALGVTVVLPPEGVATCIREAGIGFMFAPAFHPAMKHAGPVRRELGVRTAFNLLGPLCNPAGARRQVVGVPSAELARKLAGVLARLDCELALVVHSAGLDELSMAGECLAWRVEQGKVEEELIEPRALGLRAASREDLRGGDAQANAAIARDLLQGEDVPSRDSVLLNASAALLVAGVADDLRHGLELARASLDQGGAERALRDLVRCSAAAALEQAPA